MADHVSQDSERETASHPWSDGCAAPPVIRLLVLDIDNTIFDWFYFWFHSFSAMVAEVLQRVDIDRSALLKEIRTVHRRHKTTEYSWLLEELPSVARLPVRLRNETIRASQRKYREARERTEHLYPDVLATLMYIKLRKTGIVGFTESQRFYTIQRLKRFGLDGVLDVLYCAREHETPGDIDLGLERSKPNEAYTLEKTRVVELHARVRKPNPRVLQSIIAELHASSKSTLYVGDSKMKDVYMAQSAGVHDAYAAYGDSMKEAGYNLLREVSSWSDEEIAMEKLMAIEVVPSIELRDSFAEILEWFNFEKLGV